MVRWLSRGLGVDLSPARAQVGYGALDWEVLVAARELGLANVKRERARLRERVRGAVELGAKAIIHEGVRLVINNGVLVTVIRVSRGSSRVSPHIKGRKPETMEAV